MPAAQFSARITLSRHRQKSLDTGMESYIVQLHFSDAFDSESHWSVFQIDMYCVGGSVLSICREYLYNRWHRVVVDSSTSEWISIVSGVPQGSALGALLFILSACIRAGEKHSICLC